jgi:hypothetical protein
VFLAATMLLLTSACGGGPSPSERTFEPTPTPLHPRFITTPIHAPEAFARISRFRAGVGHDYSDHTEDCRSMKHYFEPPMDTDWAAVDLRSPFDGRITKVETEWAGDKVELMPDAAPDYLVVIFHVVQARVLREGGRVREGERLGHHIGPQTMLDIAVWHRPESGERRLVSYFDVLDDYAFEAFAMVGIEARSMTIIPRAERDTFPLSCLYDGRFARDPRLADSPVDWIELGDGE